MSLRYALLGLLSEQPMSGYDLTKRFEESLRNVWPAKHSQIYPELNRLNEKGLIEVVSEGPRGRKEYRATREGREAVRRWLTETDPEWAVRSEPLLRSFFLWMVEPEEARRHLRRHRDHFQERVDTYKQRKRVWNPETPGDRARSAVMESGIMIGEANVAWAEWALEQYADDGDDESGTA